MFDKKLLHFLLLNRRNKKLEAEVARLQAQVETMREAAASLIAYRDKAGPLNFQLEKADDFIERLRAALGGE